MILPGVAALAIFTQLCITEVASGFSPNVTVQSCSSRRVVVHIARAAEGGLAYIQGRGSDCSHTTNANNMEVKFDFTTCSIEYDVKFRLVVQEHPRYQTGTDKVIPIMCLVDMSDLVVSGVVFPEETLDKSVNKTTKPTLRMRVLPADDVNGDDVILEEVTLDDKLKLTLRLDDPFLSDFDIKAKDCSAALIPIVRDECSPDEDLFPNFKKKTQGDIVSVFRAFQPTNIAGDPDVDVSFTCSVSVCRGKCSNTVCGEVVGWGRRKRDSDLDVIVEKVTVGTSIRVKSPGHHKAIGLSRHDQPVYCAEKVVVTTITTITAATLIFSWVVCGCVVSKLRKFGRAPGAPRKPSAIRRLSEANMNFARSVGRRLSTMLNLPVGYDMNAPKMMDCIPEVESTPETKRRDSVVVSDDVKLGNDGVIFGNDDVAFGNDDVKFGNDDVIVGTHGVRKRRVDVGSQTDVQIHDRVALVKSSNERPSNTYRMFNPIAFLSEKYRSSAFAQKQKLENDKNVPQARSIDRATCNGLTTESRKSKGKLNPACLYYTSDDVPKHRTPYIGTYRTRSISVPKENEIQDGAPIPTKTNRLDLKMFQHNRGHVNRPSASDSGVFELGSSTNLDVEYDRSRSETPPVDYDCPTEGHDILTSQSGYDVSNDVTDAINDDVFADSPVGQDRQTNDIATSEKHNETQHIDHDIAQRMCDVGVSRDGVSRDIHVDDDGLYEPIEFGAQLKRNRTHSTHV